MNQQPFCWTFHYIKQEPNELMFLTNFKVCSFLERVALQTDDSM
jgi:hypothetical protein